MADNREYEEGTIYEAGVGIYFSDGEDHTNINVEDEVLAQINQNTEDIEALDTRMTTAEGNISALDGRLTTAEGDIDNLEGRMTTAEGDIDALEGRMNTAEGDITALEGRMTTAEGDIDNLEGRMTTAEGDIDALEGRMTTAEGDIDAVELRVTAIENDPTTVDVGTTTTGAEGTQASVTNSGTTHNAVFNFTIPKGDTGATGPQGPTGPAGPGVAAGGTAGQVLSKVDGTDYNTQWINPPSGIEWESKDPATFSASDITSGKDFYFKFGMSSSPSTYFTSTISTVKYRQGSTPTIFARGICITGTTYHVTLWVGDGGAGPTFVVAGIGEFASSYASHAYEVVKAVDISGLTFSFNTSTHALSCTSGVGRQNYGTPGYPNYIKEYCANGPVRIRVQINMDGNVTNMVRCNVDFHRYNGATNGTFNNYYLYAELPFIYQNTLYKIGIKCSDFNSLLTASYWSATFIS